MTKDDKQLEFAMSEFKLAYYKMLIAVNNYERNTNKSVNDLPGFTESYPFDKSLDELAIGTWVDCVSENMRKPNFKVLSYQYLNTGGNTMVGIFEVWLPAEKRMLYAMVNECGCSLAVFNYICNETDIEIDELIVASVEYGELKGDEQYFELYRHCLNEYTKDDCKYFGDTRQIPYHLLSDALQEQVTADYLAWCTDEGLDIETDGNKVILSPDYEA